MTAFTTSMIPSDVTTIERLHVWTGAILSRYNSKFSFQEVVSGSLVPIATQTIFNCPDGSQRLVTRISLDYDPAWSSDKSHSMWYWAKEQSQISNVAASFLP
jgi:hypothetical protein